MEDYIRIGLMTFIGVILILMFIESRARPQPEKKKKSNAKSGEIAVYSSQPLPQSQQQDMFNQPQQAVAEVSPAKNKVAMPEDDLLVISIFAKSQQLFGSYDLLQALSSAGMQYGEMNIFHYYVPSPNGRQSLFSLASATEPGEFDLSRIGDFSCTGLTMFMKLKSAENPEQAFETMWRTAERLSDDLDGELRAGLRHVFNQELLAKYRSKAERFGAMKLEPAM